MPDQTRTLEQRLAPHPHLKQHLQALLDIVEDVEGTASTADAAEAALIEQMRAMGQTVLQQWAKTKQDQQVNELRQSQAHSTSHGKKTLFSTPPLAK